jgi:[acyl-carrier-protein] S-malonyltransferase
MGSVAWVFPGQGSQQVGAGSDLYETSSPARRTFIEADRVLGFPLSDLCFQGPEDTLRQTVNAQPAIMAVSLACLEAAREAGVLSRLTSAFVAGHSLGEYTALVAAGALDVADSLRLVRERGRLMQEAGETSPGTMAALLGLDLEAAEAVCRESGAELCNVNAPGQIVIGGSPDAVETAADLARGRGARRVTMLNVSGAFHTSLMGPAVEGMADAIAATPFRDPETPVIANGTGLPLSDAAAIREELPYQLTHPVLWQRSVEEMARAGVTTFVEIGPGRVLTGLVKRIVPDAVLINIDGAAAIEALRREEP